MSILSRIDMLEATRLTREGRLADAMAILQGHRAAGASEDAPATTRSDGADDGRQPTIIDGVFERVGARSAESASPPANPVSPRGTRPGGSFEAHSYADANGRRDYKLFIPGKSASGAVPLLVMLHGCTQSPDDFAAGTRMNELAEANGFLVAYPAQSRSANASGCWNWFNAADQLRDGGEPALIAGITREVIAALPVDPARVYVAGLSAGGAAAAIMGARYPDLFAAIGVHSGLACGAARDMGSAFSAMQRGAPETSRATATIPTIVFHGDRDSTVHPRNGEQVIAQSMGRAAFTTTRTHGRSPGGTRYTKILHADHDGGTVLEHWQLSGVGHAWSGGSSAGSYTYPDGPDASAEMVRFFLAHLNRRENGVS